MIDWVTFSAPCEHAQQLCGGHIVSLQPDGEVDWKVTRWLPVRSSAETDIQVRSHPVKEGWIQVSGNPAKWFQGHNVFGTDDLPGLVLETLWTLTDKMGLTPSPRDRQLWEQGAIEVSRVDVNYSYSLGNRLRVLTAIKALEESAYLVHRGRGQLDREGTVYWGKNSRRWGLKAYCKADELVVHRLTAKADPEDLVTKFAEDKLRVEAVLRQMELKDRGLHLVANWGPGTATVVYNDCLSRLQISEGAMIISDVMDDLPPRLRGAYQCWLAGHDLRQMYQSRTWYRYRRDLLKHGVDIALQHPKREDSNVLPLRIVLQAIPASVPDWAIGTPYYFEPRRIKARTPLSAA